MWWKGLNSVKTGSKWAKTTCLSIPNGLVSVVEKRVFNPFWTLFCPKSTHFQGILGFSMSQNPSPRPQNGLKPIV